MGSQRDEAMLSAGRDGTLVEFCAKKKGKKSRPSAGVAIMMQFITQQAAQLLFQPAFFATHLIGKGRA